MATFNATKEFYVISCCRCGVDFAIRDSFDNRLRETHQLFYCPNGHSQHYAGKTEAEKLREQLEREQKRTAREQAAHDQTRAELRETEARRRGEKAAKTRLKNRVAKGVCPCCNRSFANVERHMANQHPDFAGGDS